jgi:hypothetical protein
VSATAAVPVASGVAVPVGPRLPPLPSASSALSEEAAEGILPAGDARLLELTSFGAEPREILRHAPADGAEQSVELVVDIRSAVGGEVSFDARGTTEQPSPRLALELRTKVMDADPEDDKLGLVVEVARAALVPESEADKVLAAEMAVVVASLVGVTSRIELGQRGLGVVQSPLPPGTAPEVAQLWTSVAEALGDMIPAFPEQPVGVGASWRVMSRLERAGPSWLRLATVRLVRFDHARVLLAADVEERAVRTRRSPAVPVEAVVLGVIAGAGSGKQRLLQERSAVVPIWFEAETRFSARMQVELAPDAGVAAEPPAPGTVHVEQRLRVRRPGTPTDPEAAFAAGWEPGGAPPAAPGQGGDAAPEQAPAHEEHDGEP